MRTTKMRVKGPRCIHCDTEIRDAHPIQPFSRVYSRECHARDGDYCERALTPKEKARGMR